MKRNLFFAALATVVILAGSCETTSRDATLSPTPAATSPPASTENIDAAIRQLVQDRDAAIRTADTATIERIYADGYISTSPTGMVRTKSEVIGDFKTGALKIESIDSDQITVHPYGDSAVVTGRTRIKGMDKNRALSGENRFTQVYAKRNGQWQIVAFHFSEIAK